MSLADNVKKQDLLNDINRDIPSGVNWRAGAQSYVERCFKAESRGAVEIYSLIKPFAYVLPGLDPLPELIWYFSDFVNLMSFLRPASGSRFLDVACGGGWISHWLSKMKYSTFGIDLSSEFVALAKHRIVEDQYLGVAAERFYNALSSYLLCFPLLQIAIGRLQRSRRSSPGARCAR